MSEHLKEMVMNTELHSKLLKVGREIEKDTTHNLEPEIIEGIIATFDHFGISDRRTYQMVVDLMPTGHEYVSQIQHTRFVPKMHPQYKIFDWLGFMYDGAYKVGDDDDDLVFKIVERMVEHYIAMKHVGGWAWSYRGHIDLEMDLDNNEPYANGKHCQDCIDSYESWHNQTNAERIAEQNELEEIYGPTIN